MASASPITNTQKQCLPDSSVETMGVFDKRIVVIVPSYNEERFIGSVVLKLTRYPVSIIVVDDGSTDDTASVAAEAGAIVIRQAYNQGKGAALNAGFQRARQMNPQVIVMIDADGQHLPEELPRVIQPVLDDIADVVVGSRYLLHTNRIPAHRVFGHFLFRLLTSAVSGVAITDTQSGYRAFSPRAFDLVNFRSRGFSVESEMQFMVHDHGLRIMEVPITIQYTDPPKRSVIRQGLNVLNGVLKLTGQYRPLLFFGFPGSAILVLGVSWGFGVVDTFSRTHILPIGNTLFSVLLAILGMTMFSTGIILHSVRGLLNDILQPKG